MNGLSGFFRALANSERLKIIELLSSNGEMTPSQIESFLFLAQTTVSHHLNMMLGLGILISRRDGRNAYYSIATETITENIRLFCKTFMEDITF